MPLDGPAPPSMMHGSFNQPPMQPAGPFESFGVAELGGSIGGVDGMGGGSKYPGVVNAVVDSWSANTIGNVNSADVGVAGVGLNRAKSATATTYTI